MRFLADENIPLASIRLLQSAGHHVEYSREVMPGSADEAILSRAVTENLIVLTFDQDFGALVFQRSAEPPSGVVLFRFDPVSPEHAANLLISAIGQGAVLDGRFTVIHEDRFRQRPLP